MRINNKQNRNRSQDKSTRIAKQNFRQSLIHNFSECDDRNRAYNVARSMVLLHSRTKQRDIPRSYSAASTSSHVQTVTRATNYLEEIGIFSVFRSYKRVNRYSFNHMDVLSEFFGLPESLNVMYARLFESKLNINTKLLGNSEQKSRFEIEMNQKGESEKEIFPKSRFGGCYVPPELRPWNNTIEVSWADRASLVGVEYNNKLTDYEKLESVAAIRARRDAIMKRTMEDKLRYQRMIESLGPKCERMSEKDLIKYYFSK